MPKQVASAFLAFLLSFSLFAQRSIDVSEMNPHLKDIPNIIIAEYFNDSLYLGGNIAFIDDHVVNPIVKISESGVLDPNFSFKEPYTLELQNRLTGPRVIFDGKLFLTIDNSLRKLKSNGSIDEGFQLSNSSYVNAVIVHQDSLLVLSAASELTLYASNGQYRELKTYLDNGYFLLNLHFLSVDQFLLTIQDRSSGEFQFRLFKDGVEVPTFNPVKLNQPGNITNIELLESGEILVSGKDFVLNDIAGNGTYIIANDGQISNNSFHTSDLSFLDIFNTGIEYVCSDGAGKYFVIGHNDGAMYNHYALGKLLQSGDRDDEFIIKNYFRVEGYTVPKIIKTSHDTFFLLAEQTEYDGQPTSPITLIDINGEFSPGFSLTVSGYAISDCFVYNGDSEYMIGGTFTSSKNNINSHISTISLTGQQSSIDYPVDLKPGDIFGSLKRMENGDLLIAAYYRDRPGIFRVYRNGVEVTISQVVNVLSVEKPVYDIHENEEAIYATGALLYFNSNLTKYGVVKMNKNYEIDQSYTPVPVEYGDRIVKSFLNKEGKLIIQRANFNDGTNEIIRLDSNGKKDASFNDIDMSNTLFYGAPEFQMIGDSIILAYAMGQSNFQTIKSYDLEGNIIDNQLLQMTNCQELTDVQPLSDSTLLISGRFQAVNGIPREGIALVGYNGLVYDDLNLDLVGRVDQMELVGDTLLMLGAAAIDGNNTGGFNALLLKPDSASIISIENNTSGEIFLSWESNSAIRQYEIVRNDGSSDDLLATLSKGSNSFTDVSAEPNTTYTYKIISKNLFGQNETGQHTYEIVKPSSPSDLSVEFVEGDLALNWVDNSDNEIGFNLYRSVDGGNFELLAEMEANTSSFVDEGIPVDATYAYLVEAVSSNFASDKSNEAKIEVFRPQSPINFVGSFDDDSDVVTLSWQEVDATADQIIISISLDNVNFEDIDTVSLDVTSYSIELENPEDVYYFNLRSSNAFGTSESTAPIEIRTVITGLEEVAHFIIYPNPTSGLLNLKSSEILQQIQITEISGKHLRTISTDLQSQRTIDLSFLSRGIYLMKIKTNDQWILKKLIIE